MWMWFRKRQVLESPVPLPEPIPVPAPQLDAHAEARRRMYERIAHHCAMLDVEEMAQRKWRGQ